MMGVRWLVVCAAALAVPTVARADWAYTHWGMTPDKVVAASAGKVKVLPVADQTRNEADHWVLAAQGTYQDGGLSLQVGFTFDTSGGGLKCVLYNASGDDVEALRTLLVKRYGKPAEESSFGQTRMVTWKTPDMVEFAANQSPVVAVVSHCAP
jgi:hypothetical protein